MVIAISLGQEKFSKRSAGCITGSELVNQTASQSGSEVTSEALWPSMLRMMNKSTLINLSNRMAIDGQRPLDQLGNGEEVGD